MIIFIDGVWKDDGSIFENCMVTVGKPRQVVDDSDVFFHFKDMHEFHEAFMYGECDFNITDWRV